MVPLIGSQDNEEHLIIGFNIIEEVIKRNSNPSASNVLPQIVNDSLLSLKESVKESEARVLVNLIQSLGSEPDTAVLRVAKQDIHIAAGGNVKVKCQVHFGPLEEDLPVVLKRKEEGAWSCGLVVKGYLHRIKPGSSSHIQLFQLTLSEQSLKPTRRDRMVVRVEVEGCCMYRILMKYNDFVGFFFLFRHVKTKFFHATVNLRGILAIKTMQL